MIKMTLEKAASKSGGDKYSGTVDNEPVSFYIPQSISRANGKPFQSLTVTIEATK